MSRLDANAKAALDGHAVRPVFFAFLDILDDPVRACTAGRSMSLAGTGDDDLDGFTFDGINPTVVDISPVKNSAGGSGTVTAKLSGIAALDQDMLEQVGDPANWQGRTARLWKMIRDGDGAQRGAIQHYYTGYMVALSVGGSPEGQTINLTIESYLAAFSEASNRTYLDQESFDPGDLSARASIAIANGISGTPIVQNTMNFGDLWRHAARQAQQ